ncbi:MAG: NF038122 family metalloprotease, partial [Pseudomonadota bacterium]|nr:NF038122 family metalloprotease [Pseudomonadota bacterium]
LHSALGALLAAGAIAAAQPAQALTIQLIDVGVNPMTPQQLAAFEAAAQIWEDRFSDPITVTLNIAWDAANTFSSSSVLAATTTARTTISAATVRACMLADASGSTESGAVTPLPISIPVTDVNGARNDNQVTMGFANAKALGVSPALDPVYGAALANNADGQVRYNTAFAAQFDLDRSNGIALNQFDFIGVAAHEIGHALGFFSLTDVQDGNPGFTLHPNTLDLWRFVESGGFHNVNNENRQVAAADAEYYDSVMNNVPFSRGVLLSDPLCNGANSTCQASHWQDDQGNLMDPTVAMGVQVNPTGEDLHAMDYIGYDRGIGILPWWRWYRLELRFFDPVCLSCPPEFFRNYFPDYAPPPNFERIKPPFSGANAALYVGLDSAVEGLRRRSGLGFARFAAAARNPRPTVLKPATVQGKPWEQEEFARKPLEVLPPRLLDFYFESDAVAGPKFRFRGAFSRNGAQFDATLGKYGGFRVSGAIDADGDGARGDIDATMTMVLLLDQPANVSKSVLETSYTIDVQTVDNGVRLIDYAAFGLPQPKAGR